MQRWFRVSVGPSLIWYPGTAILLIATSLYVSADISVHKERNRSYMGVLCDPTFSGVRLSRKHLITLIFSLRYHGKPILVGNPGELYWHLVPLGEVRNWYY